MSLNLLTSRKSPLIKPRTTDESLHFRKPKRFRLLSICANAVYNVIQSLKDISSIRIFYKDFREALKYVDEFSELKKNDEIQKEHIYLSLSLSLSMHFDFPERMWMYQSLSLSIYICKNSLDPDQTRMEFRKECFVNLKICACDMSYKSRWAR